ncbi:MAG: GDSL-type esterase/lipase family protein [Halioglobus sp.]
MKPWLKYLLIALGAIAVLLSFPAYYLYGEFSKAASEDPVVWESDIRALEQTTRGPPGSVLFIGSSSIRLWDSLAQDMLPMTTIRRGFGGAKMADTVYYAQRLVDIEQPAAIVIFVGTNDIHPGEVKEPEVLLQSYQRLVAEIRGVHSLTPIFYIAITPSVMRWEIWPVAQETNRLIAQYSATDTALHFIDTGPALMHSGRPGKQFYRRDGLHLSEAGYQVWTDIIRARLLEVTPALNAPR